MRSIPAALLLATISLPAWAQTIDPAANPAPSTAAVPATPVAPTDKAETGRIERHIADLHRRLAITAAEEPLWKTFADSMRANAQRIEIRRADRTTPTASRTALEDMRNYAALTREHADDVERLVPPFTALYDAMTPDRRKLADKVFADFRQGRDGKGHHRS